MTSVLEQTYSDIEYIVIDGGSTDGSKEYIETHRDSLNYWVSEPDSGIYNAMNKGIDKATGEYLLFLNSGDWLVDGEVIKNIKPNGFNKDIVSGGIHVRGLNKDFIKNPPEKINFSFLYKDTLPHQSTFIKKMLFNKIGYYDENLKIVADWKFFILAICKYSATYKHINKVVSLFNLEGVSSKRENIHNLKRERKEVLETEFNVYLHGLEQIEDLNRTIKNLRKSKWINLLIKFGLINRF